MTEIAPVAEDGAAWSSSLRFERLARAVQALTAARTREDVIETVRGSARSLSGAMGVAIVLKAGDQCHYLVEDSAAPLWSGQRFPMDACISGWAMKHSQQVIIPDIYADPRVPHAAYRPTGIHSLVMTPVGEPYAFAALGAYWTQVRMPAPDEVAVLAALAHCMGAALQNIQLVESLQVETEHQQVLINELNHRVKNTLAIIQSIARQSLRGERSAAEAGADFEGRLMALSNAHNLVTDTRWRPIEANRLFEDGLRPFGYGIDEGRIELDGPEMSLGPRTAVAFALALHELGSNAAKYGALSVPAGKVAIHWRISDGQQPRLRLVWRETGGPAVTRPAAPGLGTRLIERGLAAELSGSVKLSFPPEGVVCEIDAPAPSGRDAERELSLSPSEPSAPSAEGPRFGGCFAEGFRPI